MKWISVYFILKTYVPLDLKYWGGSLTSRDGRSDVTGTCENNFKCQFTRFLSEFRKTHLMMSRLSSVTGR